MWVREERSTSLTPGVDASPAWRAPAVSIRIRKRQICILTGPRQYGGSVDDVGLGRCGTHRRLRNRQLIAVDPWHWIGGKIRWRGVDPLLDLYVSATPACVAVVVWTKPPAVGSGCLRKPTCVVSPR